MLRIMKWNTKNIKCIGSLIWIIISFGISIPSLDFDHLSIDNNWWQYFLISTSIIGTICIFIFSDNIKASRLYLWASVLLALSLIYFIVCALFVISGENRSLVFILTPCLILLVAILNYYQARKKIRSEV